MPLPGAAAPSYSSTRVQKAYRLNGIEGIRLQWRLQILDRQKVHAVRLVNQDIRLTRVALEHIHLSSGVSVRREEISSEVAVLSAADGPMFMYGERQVSRKQGKGRRAHSAAVESSRRRAPVADEASARRPQTAAVTTFSAVKERADRELRSIFPAVEPGNLFSPAQAVEGSRDAFHSLESRAFGEGSDRPAVADRGGAQLGKVADAGEKSARARTALPPGRERKRPAVSDPPLGGAAAEGGGATIPSDRILEPPAADATAAVGPLPSSTWNSATAPERAKSSPARQSSRAEQTTAEVRRARVLSGRAKKFRNSVVGDPLLDQTLPMAEKKRKRKEALLESRKDLQRLEDMSVSERVQQYLVRHAVRKESPDADTAEKQQSL